MTWEWDRGNIGTGVFGFRVEPVTKTLDGKVIADVTAARNHEDQELEVLQVTPEVLDLVRSRIKKSIGRTADIPIMCGPDWGQGAIAFGIISGRVELIRVYMLRGQGDFPTWERTAFRLTGENTLRTPVQFQCRHTETGRPVELRRTRLWLFQQGIRALAEDTRRRPKVQLHTT